MKIAFVSTYDAREVHQWSGLGRFISGALESQGVELNYVGGLDLYRSPLVRAFHAWERLGGRRFLTDREPSVARHFAMQATRRIPVDCDAIFSPGVVPVAWLQTDKPVFIYSDATFGQMVNYYDEYKNLSPRSIRSGEILERRGLHVSALCMFASEWAAKAAIERYKVPSERVQVVPFGANLENPPPRERILSEIKDRSTTTCHLLFWGVDWVRKRGDFAVEVTRWLRNSGIDAVLHVVGIRKMPVRLPDFVVDYGFLSKASKTQYEQLQSILKSVHFLLLPTLAEAFGLVFCESSAYGIPSIATRTGGVPSAVREGINGYLLDPSESPESYGVKIAQLWRAQGEYQRIAASAREEYDSRLNWTSSGRLMKNCMEERVQRMKLP